MQAVINSSQNSVYFRSISYVRCFIFKIFRIIRFDVFMPLTNRIKEVESKSSPYYIPPRLRPWGSYIAVPWVVDGGGWSTPYAGRPTLGEEPW